MTATAATHASGSGALEGRKPVDLDPEADALVAGSRGRRTQSLARNERVASIVVGGSFLAVASAIALGSVSARHPPVETVLVLLVAYAVASKVEFEIGAGYAVPTELLLIPMFVLLPANLVPLVVAAGLVLGEVVIRRSHGDHLERIAVLPGNAWHAIGPALVLIAAGEPASWSAWPIFLAAFVAQMAFDCSSSAAREWIAFRLRPRAHLRYMTWVWMVDGALAPVGLAVALAASTGWQAALLVLPLIGLLGVFARQRRDGIDRALELGYAYRGTAFLLGDVVEADDSYTGGHCRDVVDLVLAVVDQLGVDARGRRNAEFAALLHDVGKIRIPKSIINKPGPLTPEERALVETHTTQGEQMLAQVGGLLGEVGRIVRSHHERYDGSGYPDQLKGEEIPLIGRIVCCCDAFNAMTTDRPYRKALPVHAALAELHAQAGRQFDPIVVEALTTVLTNSTTR